MTARVATLAGLAEPGGSRLAVVTTPDALLQRVPPKSSWAGASLRLRPGDRLDVDAHREWLLRSGYILDERVDEPGEAAIRGAVIEIYPASNLPVRGEHSQGRITSIHSYDPTTQRTVRDLDELVLDPASELAGTGSTAPEVDALPERGLEHWLSLFYPRLEAIFDDLPNATITASPGAVDRAAAFLDQIRDAFQFRGDSRAVVGPDGEPRAWLPPERLYLREEDWAALRSDRGLAEIKNQIEPPLERPPGHLGP